MNNIAALSGQGPFDGMFDDILGDGPTNVTETNASVALDLAQKGFVVFPICDWGDGDGWKPIARFPELASKSAKQIRKWWAQWPNARVGLLTGSRNGITVLDVDVKNGKDGTESLTSIGLADVASITPYRVRTPSGGWHLIFQYAQGVKNTVGRIGVGLDVRNERAFVIAPGSYKDGKRYEIAGDPFDRMSDLPPVPAEILSRVAARDDLPSVPVAIQIASEWQRDWAEGKLRDHAEYVATASDGHRQATLNNAVLQCAGYAAHGAITEQQARDALSPAGLACGLSEREVASTFKHAWADGLKKPLALPDDCEDEFGEEFENFDKTDPLPAVWGGNAFKLGKLMTANGKLISNAHNTILILNRDADRIVPALRHNLMSGRDEWRQGEVDDAVVMLARVGLEQGGLSRIGKDLVSDAITTVARLREYHPIRDWLTSLRHDGTPRLDTWLSHYMGAQDTAYSRGVGRAFLISMVARVMRPGCKVDHALVLTGPQGIGKSSACRILSGDDYFSDSMPSVTGDSKEARQHLMGKWLVELSELAPARRSDAEDLKAFISGKADKVRLPYARRDQTLQRQCVFIGTTNEGEFLNDPTGGRRWWPVELSAQIDLEALEQGREQIFAEAVSAYDSGEIWWLDSAFEREHAEPVRKLAEISDPWEDLITAYLDDGGDDLDDDAHVARSEVRVVDILRLAIYLPEAQHTRATQKRVTDVLKRQGFAKHHTRSGKVWRRDP